MPGDDVTIEVNGREADPLAARTRAELAALTADIPPNLR
jgi:antitoxin component of MazEF toxin-antitoxin module